MNLARRIGSRPGESRRCAGLSSAAMGTMLALGLAAMGSGIAAGGVADQTKPGTPPAARSLVERVAVFGTDDRVVLPAQRKTLQNSIGLLHEAITQTICTAFCVDDATIATAGHCLFRTEGDKAPSLSGFTFRLGGTSSAIQGASHGAGGQFIAASARQLRTRPPIDAVHDWAMVRLAAPVCKGHALRVSRRAQDELVRLSAEDRIYQVAYHRDFGNWQLALGAPCAIRRDFATADRRTVGRDFADADLVILHTCDTGGASSGSPLLMDGPSGPEVIGINVGTYVQSRVLTQHGEVLHRYKSDSVANTGVSAAAFVDTLEAFKRADILATRAKIRELQSLLAREGLYAGRRDGLYGAELKRAIESFERAEGRVETGFATTAVMTRLKARLAERSDEPEAALETGSVSRSESRHEVLRATAPAASNPLERHPLAR